MLTQLEMDVLWPDRGSDCSCGSHRYIGHDDELYCYTCNARHVQQMGVNVTRAKAYEDMLVLMVRRLKDAGQDVPGIAMELGITESRARDLVEGM